MILLTTNEIDFGSTDHVNIPVYGHEICWHVASVILEGSRTFYIT
jgi:hypothetical protein